MKKVSSFLKCSQLSRRMFEEVGFQCSVILQTKRFSKIGPIEVKYDTMASMVDPDSLDGSGSKQNKFKTIFCIADKIRVFVKNLYQQEIPRNHPKSPAFDAEQNFIDPGKKILRQDARKDVPKTSVGFSTSVVKSRMTFSQVSSYLDFILHSFCSA